MVFHETCDLASYLKKVYLKFIILNMDVFSTLNNKGRVHSEGGW